jgi:hypothetical protein
LNSVTILHVPSSFLQTLFLAISKTPHTATAFHDTEFKWKLHYKWAEVSTVCPECDCFLHQHTNKEYLKLSRTNNA